jgi:hypothetical protein
MLPALPIYLQYLSCAYNYITWLASLPPHIEEIECQCNELVRLPPIPITVTRINASHNQLMEYPHVTHQDVHMIVDNNPLQEHVLDASESITIDSTTSIEVLHLYSCHCRALYKLYEIKESQTRAHARCAAIKEEIMKKAWHPSRVLYLLEAGYDVEDM